MPIPVVCLRIVVLWIDREVWCAVRGVPSAVTIVYVIEAGAQTSSAVHRLTTARTADALMREHLAQAHKLHYRYQKVSGLRGQAQPPQRRATLRHRGLVDVSPHADAARWPSGRPTIGERQMTADSLATIGATSDSGGPD
jgi:hypothetical protein